MDYEEKIDRREFDGYLKAKIEEMTNMKKEIETINDKIDKLSIIVSQSNSDNANKIENLRTEIKLMFEKQSHINFKNYLKLSTLSMAVGAVFGFIGGFLHKYINLF